MHSDLLPIDLDLLSVSDWTCGLLYQSCLDILNCTPSVKTLSDLCPWLPAGLPSWSNSDLSTARQPKQTLKAKRTLNISLVFYTLWHSAMTSFDSSIHYFFFFLDCIFTVDIPLDVIISTSMHFAHFSFWRSLIFLLCSPLLDPLFLCVCFSLVMKSPLI